MLRHVAQGVCFLQDLRRCPRKLALAVFVCLMPYAYVSLSLDVAWPDPAPNAARWTNDGTLAFDRPGRALTPSPPPWLAWVKRTHRLELALRVRPAAHQLGTILTISRDLYARNLLVEQRGDRLLVSVATTCGGIRLLIRTCGAGVQLSGILHPGRWTDFRLRIEPGRLDLRAGPISERAELAPLPLSSWDDGYRLALGNQVTGGRAWLGEIAQAKLRTPGAVADYVDPARVEVETELRPLDRIKLVPFASFTSKDVARNAIMYIPLGGAFALLGLFPGRRGALRGVATLGLISLSMETAQVFLADRNPSVNDLILNTGGGAVAFLLTRAVLARLQPWLRRYAGSAPIG